MSYPSIILAKKANLFTSIRHTQANLHQPNEAGGRVTKGQIAFRIYAGVINEDVPKKTKT